MDSNQLPQQIIPPTEAHQSSQLEPKKTFTKTQIGLMSAIILLMITFIGGGIYFFTKPKTVEPRTQVTATPGPDDTVIGTAVISGKLDINGDIPTGAIVTIRARDLSEATNSANIRALDIAAKDASNWQITNLDIGKSYEISARLISSKLIYGESEPVFISAPAAEESLRINIDPKYQSTTAKADAVISGTIRTNGYIPPNSTILVEGKKLGATTYTTIANNLPAQKNQTLTYSTAISGQSYEVRGKLLNNGTTIGTSNIIVLTAPAQNEILEINSTAQSPIATTAPTTENTQGSQNSVVSGYINLNGAVPEGATMVVLSRASGTTNYQTVQDSIQPKDDVAWQWSGGQIGKSFDIKAVLKKPNGDGTYTDISTSNTITVTVPAENQQLSINSSFQLPSPPSGKISVNCQTKNNSTNQWSSVVSYGSIDNANAYWFQVGTTNGGNDYVNTSLQSIGGETQITNVTLNDSITYYARYAYSYNQNATTNSPNDFSPFSQTFSFKCPR